MAFSPPAGWRVLPSSLPTVQVWGPPDTSEEATGPESFSCPQCGAATAFDPSKGALSCQHCGYQAEHKVRVEAEVGEFTAEALGASARGWGVERQALHCDTCGAELAVAEGQLAASCPFCASAKVDLRAVSGGALRPQRVIPFAVNAQEVGALASAWIGTGWKRPAELSEVAQVDRFVAVYLPWWLFDARLEVDWECEVGVDRTVTTRDAKGNTSTRTVTDWHWASGHLRPAYSKVMVSGTSKVPGVGKLSGFPMEQLRPYDPGLLAGYAAHAYDVSLTEAWDQGRHIMRTWAADACLSAAGGDRQRNLSLSADLQDEAWTYALLPVYVSAYTFRDRSWVVLVNGATGEVAGQRPVAWWKVYLAMAAMLTPGLFTGICLGLPGLLVAGLGVVFLIFAAVFLVFGAAGAGMTYNAAVQEESL